MSVPPYPKNAPGDFYVENGCCIFCRAPEAEAPDLMAHHDDGPGYHCYFRRQPSTPEERERAIQACVVSCVKAVRYRGNDPEILRRFIALRAKNSCDALERTASRSDFTMGRSEWAYSSNVSRMLKFLRMSYRMSDRKWRLFAIACCRRMNSPYESILRLAERYADGIASDFELENACHGHTLPEVIRWAKRIDGSTLRAAAETAHSMAKSQEDPLREELAQSDLLRDIFNPWATTPVDEPWMTPDLTALAKVIYQQHAFHRIHELAEAAKAAGCKDDELLRHFRSEGDHVRGCWAVDRLLGDPTGSIGRYRPPFRRPWPRGHSAS